MSECRNWYNGDPILEEYHDHEWCKINHDDDFQFEMLCLEVLSRSTVCQSVDDPQLGTEGGTLL